jgi:hypothetical protein
MTFGPERSAAAWKRSAFGAGGVSVGSAAGSLACRKKSLVTALAGGKASTMRAV